jgi:hypothetical protein
MTQRLPKSIRRRLRRQFEEMQTDKAKAAVRALFAATPEELGAAAVRGAALPPLAFVLGEGALGSQLQMLEIEKVAHLLDAYDPSPADPEDDGWLADFVRRHTLPQDHVGEATDMIPRSNCPQNPDSCPREANSSGNPNSCSPTDHVVDLHEMIWEAERHLTSEAGVRKKKGATEAWEQVPDLDTIQAASSKVLTGGHVVDEFLEERRREAHKEGLTRVLFLDSGPETELIPAPHLVPLLQATSKESLTVGPEDQAALDDSIQNPPPISEALQRAMKQRKQSLEAAESSSSKLAPVLGSLAGEPAADCDQLSPTEALQRAEQLFDQESVEWLDGAAEAAADLLPPSEDNLREGIRKHMRGKHRRS